MFDEKFLSRVVLRAYIISVASVGCLSICFGSIETGIAIRPTRLLDLSSEGSNGSELVCLVCAVFEIENFVTRPGVAYLRYLPVENNESHHATIHPFERTRGQLEFLMSNNGCFFEWLYLSNGLFECELSYRK